MKIDSLFSEYVQKSRIFLFPLLGIRRGGSVTPIETYLSWSDSEGPINDKFYVRYYLRDDLEFKSFEEQKLINNRFFDDFYELQDGTGLYVFDLTEKYSDFYNVVTGKYSKISPESKGKILAFFRSSKKNYAYIESYLYPNKYFEMYSNMLGVDVGLLKKVGELCNKPDLEKENLDIKKKADIQVLSK